ncbi:hypothetical protein GCM10009117_07660 [Gangjinia marincola]|uniref:Uncharacterized protein n=1 Tax=Gangjinia marincola TaxID=578463 RepID=A0ABN1MFK1_9FLAO
MKNLLLIFVLIFTISSCKKTQSDNTQLNNNDSTEKRYEGEYFNFDFPDDWNITDSEGLEEGVYFLSVEKDGLDSSGLFTVVSFDEEIDLDNLVSINLEQLQNNPVIANLKFDSIRDAEFNHIKSRTSNFTFSTLGIRHEGSISAFNGDKNSYVTLKQGSLEDKNKNSNGFSTIENSFETK